MLKRFSKWSMLLVVMMSFSLVFAACGEQATPVAGGNNQNNANMPAVGVKSPMAASFPDTTSLYVTLNTDMESGQIKSWQKMVEYLSTIPEVKQVFANVDVLTLAKLGTYDADIKPWIGSEIAIGITDLSTIAGLASSMTSGNGAMPTAGKEIPALIGIPVKDQAKAEAFITKMGGQVKAMMGAEPTKEAYKDATLWTINVMVANVVVGLNKDKLFIGGGPELVKAALDRTADKSLASAAQFKQVSAKLPMGNLSYAYFDYQSAIKALGAIPEVKQAMGTAGMSNLDYMSSMGFTFATADEGFRVDAYQAFVADKMPAAMTEMLKKGANPSKILSTVPETALAFGNARDASGAYDMAMNSLKTMGSQTAEVEKGLAEFEKETGLNLKNDIVSLFTGEVAFFVSPSANNKEMPVGLGLVTEATDKAATQAKLDKIASAIESSKEAKMKWETKTVGKTTFKTAKSAEMKNVSLNIGMSGNYAFMSVGDDATTGLITAAEGGKNVTNGANKANFDKVKSMLPSDNQGYAYADVQGILKLAGEAMPTEQAQQAKKYTDSLTKLMAIGASSRQTTSEAMTSVFIYFPVTK